MSISNTYINYGVPSDWAKEYESIGISTNTFRNTSMKNLRIKYNVPDYQIEFVKNCLKRKPIDDEILQELLKKSNFTCCICKGEKSKAFIVHHIVEYSLSQDNSYSNLAVLCPNDHDLAHRDGISLTNKLSAKQIIKAKKDWEKQVEINNEESASYLPIRVKRTNWKNNPYKELLSFTQNDKDNFYGRGADVEEILIRIKKYNFIGLFGESGTGKTSLVNAGLIPKLKKEGFVIVSVRCNDNPIIRVREELLSTLKEQKVSTLLIGELAVTDTFSHAIIKLKTIVEKENLDLIIIIDQFEEIFTRAIEKEREYFSKGIIEALNKSTQNGNIYFLLSLREDYIGDLWDWAHKYNLEDAWIHQYRIKRLEELKACEAIVQPLYKLGIKTEKRFISQLISELKNIGDGLIYPPYLQIVCNSLFEEYKNQNDSLKPILEFGLNLYKDGDSVEKIIADYLSESMLADLTPEEKLDAQNILNLLTGPEGLRAILSIDDINRYLTITNDRSQPVLEHLMKKKIVHAIVEDDKVVGYELVHDFLSKKFFDKLGPEAKRSKTIIDIFRKAFRDWKQHGVLASKDRLEILFSNIKQLSLKDEEWDFIIKSSFSVYWSFENKWVKIIDPEMLKEICINLINDLYERSTLISFNDDKIAENAIRVLGETENEELTPFFINIILSPYSSISIKETAISQFSYNLVDIRIVSVLKNIILNDNNFKLRKSAVYALGNNLKKIGKKDKGIIDKEIYVLYKALDDSMSQVRKQVADVFAYTLVNEKSVNPLINRLKIEHSIISRKAIVSALVSLKFYGIAGNIVSPILENIIKNHSGKEDYRVIEEAKRGNLMPENE